ncbi:hypothetical protein RJ639_035255 [Escallonia herrerae]|uniref:Solute carrier family 35 member F1 n=1 Tax=Escallonia herrerae TaxID=1293975 RepID=A0AA88WQ51_9ASTE|nr:hypothetical protein RJ639_035255 [Escallonia herrerae]
MDTRWGSKEAMFRTLLALFLGQVVSFVLALLSFTSSLVANLGNGLFSLYLISWVDAPLTLSFFTYLALTLVYGSILLYRRERLRVPWYWYVLLGFVDVQGNYLVNKAYQYSSITSVTLLDCFTVAWAIVLTWFFLGTRYSLRQFFGAAICLVGLGLVLVSDAGVGGGGGSRPLLGDTLVIAGTIFFAMSNVGEEFFVKKKDLVEILAFTGYALAGLMFYTFSPFVLKVDWLYYLSFTFVVIGLVIYSKLYVLLLLSMNSPLEKEPVSTPALEDGSSNPQYQLIRDEIRDTREEPTSL